jgi:hypothetical protein
MSFEDISSKDVKTADPSNDEQVDRADPSLTSADPSVETSNGFQHMTEEDALNKMKGLVQNITPNITGLDIGPKPSVADQIEQSRELWCCHMALTPKWLSDEALGSADERLQQYEEDDRGWDPSFLKPEDAALRELWGKATEYYMMTRRR